MNILLQSDSIGDLVSLYGESLEQEIDQLTKMNNKVYVKLREENTRFEGLEGLEEEERKEWPDDVFWVLVLGIVVMIVLIVVMSRFDWGSLSGLFVAVLIWVVFAAIAYGFIVLFKWIIV